MAEEFNMYTGKLNYKDITFSFTFDKEELRLIPPDDKRHLVEWDWKMQPLAKGAYTFADPIPVGVDWLIGECNETNNRIIFLPKRGSYIGLYNSVVRIKLEGYILCKHNRDTIDRISFSCPEINYIHPVNQAFSYTFEDAFAEKGIITLTTQNFESTTTEEQTFIVDEKEVKAYFGISRTVSSNINEPPLSIKSTLMFEFDATDDYNFILRLWRIAKNFISFLCYRKNIFIPTVELAAPYEGGKHDKFATMYLLGEDGETESDILKKRRYIKQVHIAGREGKILSDIASDNLYLRHLPETYKNGRHIDAARFIMITAAFEWEFCRSYPDGVEKSEATVIAENAVAEEIQQQINITSGKKKKIYKFLKRLVKSDSLQAEIVQVGKDYSEIIDVFGNRLYSLNNQGMKYSEMGQRLSDQRNHFAHGDLDKDFIGLSLLDLIYLEYVIYAMQLKVYDIENVKIQKAINELFGCNIAL